MSTEAESSKHEDDQEIFDIQSSASYSSGHLETTKASFVKFLAESGLDESDVPKWEPVDMFSMNAMIGFAPHQRVQSDGCAIPYFDINGAQQLHQGIPLYRMRVFQKLTKKDGSPGPKYLSPSGTRDAVYIPAKARARIKNGASTLVIITEGEKKAELLCKMGYCAIALPGISMGLVRDDPDEKTQKRKLSPSVAELIRGAIRQGGMQQCVVLFDAEGRPRRFKKGEEIPEKMEAINKAKDAAFVRNKAVYHEAVGLAEALRWSFPDISFGAAWADIPKGWQGVDPMKAGVDDWAMSLSPNDLKRAIEEFSAGATCVSKEDVKRRNLEQEALLNEGYVPLGMERGAGGEPVAAVWSRANGCVVHLAPSGLSNQAMINATFGPNFSRAKWPKFDRNANITGLDLFAAQGEILTNCQARPNWSSTRERGGGVWNEKDGLIINCREGLLHCDHAGTFTALVDDDRFAGNSVYPRTDAYSIAINTLTEEFLSRLRDTECQRADAAVLVDHLKQWGGLGADDGLPAQLLAGWMLSQSFLGALPARPSVIVSGESGGGKSVLSEHISIFFGKTALRIDDGSSTTEPGVRQRLGNDARTLLLDEAEPGSSNAQVGQQRAGNLRRILNLLRAAYSTSDSETTDSVAALKGSASGRAVDYSLRTAAVLFAIGKPDLEQADINRSIHLEISKKDRALLVPKDPGLHELGIRMRFAMWSRWQDFQAVLAHIQALCAQPELKLNIEARLANTWGVPMAALLCLDPEVVARAANPTALNDEQRAAIDERLIALLKRVQQHQRSMLGGSEDHNDAEEALGLLLQASLRVEFAQKGADGLMRTAALTKTVRECLTAIHATASAAPEKSAFQKALRRYGVSYATSGNEEPMLFVTDGPFLRSLLAKTKFATQDIVPILKRVPGCEPSQRRNAAAYTGARYGILVPIKHVVEDTAGFEPGEMPRSGVLVEDDADMPSTSAIDEPDQDDMSW